MSEPALDMGEILLLEMLQMTEVLNCSLEEVKKLDAKEFRTIQKMIRGRNKAREYYRKNPKAFGG